MKQAFFLIIIGIIIFFTSCKKNKEFDGCPIFDPFNELGWLEGMKDVCITKAIFREKHRGRIKGWIMEPCKYSNYKIAYYSCYGIQFIEERCDPIELQEKYCK